MQAKGVADAGNAAFRVSGMELGGLFGSLLAGRISDALIARNPKGGNVGKRVQVSSNRKQLKLYGPLTQVMVALQAAPVHHALLLSSIACTVRPAHQLHWQYTDLLWCARWLLGTPWVLQLCCWPSGLHQPACHGCSGLQSS